MVSGDNRGQTLISHADSVDTDAISISGVTFKGDIVIRTRIRQDHAALCPLGCVLIEFSQLNPLTARRSSIEHTQSIQIVPIAFHAVPERQGHIVRSLAEINPRRNQTRCVERIRTIVQKRPRGK